jgi:hypothetical protein
MSIARRDRQQSVIQSEDWYQTIAETIAQHAMRNPRRHAIVATQFAPFSFGDLDLWIIRIGERHDRAVSAAEAMKSLAQRCARASLRATGPTAPGGCGKTCWRKGYRAVCIGLNG